ncbi:MAG: hypothetical protein ABI901_17445, partial [Roseiflexaceae bacterium]
EVRNTGAGALEDVLIVRGDTFAQLGALAPGASQQVTASSAQQGFPSSVDLADSGTFNRREILRALFDRDAVNLRNSGASSGPSDDQGVYLLGWASLPAISTTLDGQAATQAALTLYVIRLK